MFILCYRRDVRWKGRDGNDYKKPMQHNWTLIVLVALSAHSLLANHNQYISYLDCSCLNRDPLSEICWADWGFSRRTFHKVHKILQRVLASLLQDLLISRWYTSRCWRTMHINCRHQPCSLIQVCNYPVCSMYSYQWNHAVYDSSVGILGIVMITSFTFFFFIVKKRENSWTKLSFVKLMRLGSNQS